MAKYTFDQVKRNVAEIANRDSYTKDFIFELMAAYGRATSAINQLKAGTINKATDPDAFLQKGVLYFKVFPQSTPLEEKVEEMDFEPLSGRYEPRYIIATDLHHIVAKDTVKHTTLDIEIKDIDNEVAFFYGWTGNEINEGSADESAADRRAADKMKDLYDEIERENIDAFQANPAEFRHDLNLFFSRLLFCFFAEDTGLFEPKQFTNSIKEYTETDGSDLNIFFEELFKSLDSKDKSGMTTPYSEFPYVNGSLFDTKEHNIAIPKFSPTARHILILCADLDWSGVNPDIFGTIFQGIVDETRRDENGMDYTSVPNILKVIDPLFMDELHEEFDKAFDDQNKLFKLWGRISQIKVFDPACGSGNFLIISYKKLRELEHDIIRRIAELKHGMLGIKLNSQIKLDHFFGIELEDFPRELAVLSMYIAGIDIIIALGMAKEGFDWPYCEHALTVGYRSSLTEIVQIIGRCTRDSYNKKHAQFTNLIVQPNGTNDDIVIAVNSMLKAITVSLLMEQVLAPTFTFTPKPREPRPLKPGEITIKGLATPKTPKVKQIIASDLEDLTAAVLQDSRVEKAAAQNITGPYMKHLQSEIIRERNPGLTDEETEIVRQYLAANLATKVAEPVKDSEGNIKFLKLANRFVKIDELDINLIDSINPFHHAFEVISKKVGADTFKIIQDTIAGNRIDMRVEDALAMVPQIKAFVVAHNGKYPSLHADDNNEKILAQAQAFLTAQRAKYEREKARRTAGGES